eukprot:CAMPEP_0179345640 /NCGR_PEP_ID=MMETSP0797-20121207/72148_1 /TAXON_ID=47934 /ORGANISM="Dinophysis acuminata, Strain DAEP01" /LENGTH=270 /DNA_ID=CAMNT_0021060135 /DNA_START=73 /DNA_END=882 /DNA_ORIENTATION=-
MGRVPVESLSYRVKNTFVEIGAAPPEEGVRCRHHRSFSDTSEFLQESSPQLNASKPPGPGPPWRDAMALAGPCKSASSMPFVPNTPSPFLHPCALLHPDAIPPFSMIDPSTGLMAFGAEMALPPAFGDIMPGAAYGTDLAFDAQSLQDFYGLPAMAFDPASSAYSMSGWCMPLDVLGAGPEAGEGEGHICSAFAHHEMPLEAMLDGQGPPAGFDMDPDQPLGEMVRAEGPVWCPEGGVVAEPGGGRSLKEGPPGGQDWSPDGGLPFEQGG